MYSKPGTKRSSLEMKLCVLRAIQVLNTKPMPVGPSRIMHKANLNYSAMKPILSELLVKGLVEVETLGHKKVKRYNYKLTESGEEMLSAFMNNDLLSLELFMV